jgi:hypothetical protein
MLFALAPFQLGRVLAAPHLLSMLPFHVVALASLAALQILADPLVLPALLSILPPGFLPLLLVPHLQLSALVLLLLACAGQLSSGLALFGVMSSLEGLPARFLLMLGFPGFAPDITALMPGFSILALGLHPRVRLGPRHAPRFPVGLVVLLAMGRHGFRLLPDGRPEDRDGVAPSVGPAGFPDRVHLDHVLPRHGPADDSLEPLDAGASSHDPVLDGPVVGDVLGGADDGGVALHRQEATPDVRVDEAALLDECV